MQINFTFAGFDEAHKTLKAIAYQWQQPKSKMHSDIARIVETSIRENFNAQGRPGWPPRKDDDTHPILDKTGKMRDDAETSARAGFEKIGSVTALSIWTPIYGHFHQYKTSRASLPERKFVQFLESEIAAILFRIRQTLEEKANA